MKTRSLLGAIAICFSALVGATGCSSSSDDVEVDEGAVRDRDREPAAVDLSKYSLVSGSITTDREASEVLQNAILSTSERRDKSDRKRGHHVYAGLLLEEDDEEPVGILCQEDSVMGHACTLVSAIALSTNVEGRALPGMPGAIVPTSVKLTGKLADAISRALPRIVPAPVGAAVTGAGGITCTRPVVRDPKATCTVPLKGLAASFEVEGMIEQTKSEEGEEKARELRTSLEKAVQTLFP